MQRIAVLGGTGYLGSIIKSKKKFSKYSYFFFSRNRKLKNYIDYLDFEKNIKKLNKFDVIIYLVGSNKNQINKNKDLIKIKKNITTKVCNFCKSYNIKLIYISSLQIYKNYGLDNISMNSKINLKNFYAKSHYETEKIIFRILKNKKNIFTILRLGNVFGINKYIKENKFRDNIVHEFCYSALKNGNILINNSNIQRSFIPSDIFFKTIDEIIKKKKYNNSIINISYKIYNLKEISLIIKKRIRLILNRIVKLEAQRFSYKKKTNIYVKNDYKKKFIKKKFFYEIDKIINYMKL